MEFKLDYEICDSVEKLESEIKRVRKAQEVFAKFSQEQVDKIFLACATAANKERIPLAKLAVSETGMGVVEDKVIKNHYAAEYIYNKYRDVKTCGILEEDKAYGITKIAEPIGIVGAVIPTTIPPPCKKFYDRRGKGNLRSGCGGGCARGNYQLDRRSQPRYDQPFNERGGHHSGNRRSRYGQGGVFER